MLPSFDDYLHAKNLRDQLILSEMLIIKESCNLIGQKPQQAIPNQKR